MNQFLRTLPLLIATFSISAWAEPTTGPVSTPTPTAPKPAVAAPVPAAPKPATAPVLNAAPVATTAPLAPPAPVMTLEQRHQQELLASAEKIDKANRDLLAKNQELQLQNENLGIQVNVLQKDRSAEGIRNGAIAVIVGFFIGFFFSGTGNRRNKSGW